MNEGSVVAERAEQSGLVSNGSAELRHSKASRMYGGNVCADPGRSRTADVVRTRALRRCRSGLVRVRAVEGRQPVRRQEVPAVRHQRVDEVGPAILAARQPRASSACPRGCPRSGPSAPARRSRRRRSHRSARPSAGRRRRRVVGDLAGEVLEVVDLEAARVELRLAGGATAAVARRDEAARRVGDDDVAARGEPGVVVVPALPGPRRSWSPPSSSCCRCSSRASSRSSGSRRAAPEWSGTEMSTSSAMLPSASAPGIDAASARLRRQPS